jgi:hypothetical protein
VSSMPTKLLFSSSARLRTHTCGATHFRRKRARRTMQKQHRANIPESIRTFGACLWVLPLLASVRTERLSRGPLWPGIRNSSSGQKGRTTEHRTQIWAFLLLLCLRTDPSSTFSRWRSTALLRTGCVAVTGRWLSVRVTFAFSVRWKVFEGESTAQHRVTALGCALCILVSVLPGQHTPSPRSLAATL